MTLLSWIIPPVAGGIIGYVTNAIAIKMLFRPLEEKRVLGLKIPLTPGIIPRRRGQLAEGIGNMVSRELITAETIREHLSKEEFRTAFTRQIARVTQGVLERPLETLEGDDLHVAEEILRGVLASPRMPSVVRSVVGSAVAAVAQMETGAIVHGESVGRLVAGALPEVIVSDGAREAIRKALTEVRGGRDREDVAGRLGVLAEVLFPRASRHLVAWLEDPAVKDDLVLRGRKLLRGALEKLNTMQKLVVVAGQFDRKLEEGMAEIVSDGIRELETFLEEPATATRAAGVVRSAVLAGADGMPDGEVATSVEALLDVVRSPDVTRALSRMIEGALGDVLARPVGEVATDVLGVSMAEVEEGLSNRVLSYLSKEATPGELIALFRGIRQPGDQIVVGDFLSLSPDMKARVDGFLALGALGIFEKRLADVVQGFDVKGMVVDRINGLDMLRVERLLLMVIAQHLRWINVFGGILGAIIGLAQAALRLII